MPRVKRPKGDSTLAVNPPASARHHRQGAPRASTPSSSSSSSSASNQRVSDTDTQYPSSKFIELEAEEAEEAEEPKESGEERTEESERRDDRARREKKVGESSGAAARWSRKRPLTGGGSAPRKVTTTRVITQPSFTGIRSQPADAGRTVSTAGRSTAGISPGLDHHLFRVAHDRIRQAERRKKKKVEVRCTVCELALTSARQLEKHKLDKPHRRREQEKNAKVQRCNLCNQLFASKHDFDRHCAGASHLNKKRREATNRLVGSSRRRN